MDSAVTQRNGRDVLRRSQGRLSMVLADGIGAFRLVKADVPTRGTSRLPCVTLLEGFLETCTSVHEP